MASPKSKQTKREKPAGVETDPGAWERFEHAVDAAVKSGPKHRTATDKKVQPKRQPPKESDDAKNRD